VRSGDPVIADLAIRRSAIADVRFGDLRCGDLAICDLAICDLAICDLPLRSRVCPDGQMARWPDWKIAKLRNRHIGNREIARSRDQR
jgi:hypothetical protein